jgi:hypothetical protein
MSMHRRFVLAAGLAAVLSAACSRPFDADFVFEPIHVDRVDVSLIETVPPQAAAHVVGVVGDSCATVHSVRQARTGDLVTVTILRQRPLVAVCAQIALPYDDVIRLDGVFPPGSYLVRVNGVERAFTVG